MSHLDISFVQHFVRCLSIVFHFPRVQSVSGIVHLGWCLGKIAGGYTTHWYVVGAEKMKMHQFQTKCGRVASDKFLFR
jgi:hypothetical protein